MPLAVLVSFAKPNTLSVRTELPLTCRGGLIENIYVKDVTVGQCGEAVLRIDLQYENRENCKRGFDPTVRNVYLQNVTCEKSKFGAYIVGLEDNDHDCSWRIIKNMSYRNN